MIKFRWCFKLHKSEVVYYNLTELYDDKLADMKLSYVKAINKKQNSCAIKLRDENIRWNRTANSNIDL